MISDYFPLIAAVIGMLGSGGLLARYLLTRNEKIKQTADAATATANAAKASTEVTSAQFEIKQKEWDAVVGRLNLYITDIGRLETKVTALQEKADKDSETSRQRIDALETEVYELREQLRQSESYGLAWRIYGQAMEQAVNNLVPAVPKRAVYDRLKFMNIERPPNPNSSDKETH